MQAPKAIMKLETGMGVMPLTEPLEEKDEHGYDQWREKIEPFLISKLEEFHLLGLERLTADELWAFAKEIMQKNKVEMKCHRIVGQLMRLSVNDYMNKLRVEMFKDMDIFKDGEPLF